LSKRDAEQALISSFLIFRATQRRDLHLIALLVKILARNFILASFFYNPGISLFFKIEETDIKHMKMNIFLK